MSAVGDANEVILSYSSVFFVDFDVASALFVGHSVAEAGKAWLGSRGVEIVPVVFGRGAGKPFGD